MVLGWGNESVPNWGMPGNLLKMNEAMRQLVAQAKSRSSPTKALERGPTVGLKQATTGCGEQGLVDGCPPPPLGGC